MKKTFVATMILGVILFTACNSDTSNRNQSKNEQAEMNQMITGDSQNEMEHMQQGAQNENHAMLGVKGSCEMCKERAAAGHDTDKDKAEQTTYDALPSCCKYRE